MMPDPEDMTPEQIRRIVDHSPELLPAMPPPPGAPRDVAGGATVIEREAPGGTEPIAPSVDPVVDALQRIMDILEDMPRKMIDEFEARFGE